MIIIHIKFKYNSHFLNNPIKTDLQPIFGSRPTTRHWLLRYCIDSSLQDHIYFLILFVTSLKYFQQFNIMKNVWDLISFHLKHCTGGWDRRQSGATRILNTKAEKQSGQKPRCEWFSNDI